MRYREAVEKDWRAYFGPNADSLLTSGLLWSTSAATDSIAQFANEKIRTLPKNISPAMLRSVPGKKLRAALDYFALAKSCEKFAVREIHYDWDNIPDTLHIEAGLPEKLEHAFSNTKDQFLKERLWFQLIRYHYFCAKYTSPADSAQVDPAEPILSLFHRYSTIFPKDLTWYRASAYVAGFYYRHHNYAQANYLYSRAYDYTTAMKIPSVWSFHPQDETDWAATLALAKNKDEKITLWHMLGMQVNDIRAIREICRLDPHSEKLDLLLSRLINSRENAGYTAAGNSNENSPELPLVDSVALAGNTCKPFFWTLSAGYLHYLNHDYPGATLWYARAKKQLPQTDTLIQAQYRLLHILLEIDQARVLQGRTEQQLVEPLNWLADLRDAKKTVPNLRFSGAVAYAATALAVKYRAQGQQVRAQCFTDSAAFYRKHTLIDSMRILLNKPAKTDFEKAMLRYYTATTEELNYQQAVLYTYEENYSKAISWMQKAGKPAQTDLPANPFGSRINDCHDCDAAAPTKKHYSPLLLLETMQAIHNDIAAGKDVYRNAYLLASAFYNITHYGNSRAFFANELNKSDTYSPDYLPSAFASLFTSPMLAHKYYSLALRRAVTNEQRARCTFMLSKCARNDAYNYALLKDDFNAPWQSWKPIPEIDTYFDQLKSKYTLTAYYREALKECGDLRDYVTAPPKAGKIR